MSNKEMLIQEQGDDYSDAKFELHPDGIIFRNGKEVAHTIQCCHCMRHDTSYKGSGRVRSFCMNCKKKTCGRRRCVTQCTPFVKELNRIFGREF